MSSSTRSPRPTRHVRRRSAVVGRDFRRGGFALRSGILSPQLVPCRGTRGLGGEILQLAEQRQVSDFNSIMSAVRRLDVRERRGRTFTDQLTHSPWRQVLDSHTRRMAQGRALRPEPLRQNPGRVVGVLQWLGHRPSPGCRARRDIAGFRTARASRSGTIRWGRTRTPSRLGIAGSEWRAQEWMEENRGASPASEDWTAHLRVFAFVLRR